jgi:hypothetical protein
MIRNYRCINLKNSINGEIGLSLGEFNPDYALEKT